MALQQEHEDMVTCLVKDPNDISLGLQQKDVMHMILGISGETGELVDVVKKWLIYSKPLDRDNVIEELGDIEFYLEGLRQSLGIKRGQTLTENIAKLSKRYSSGRYSDNQANQRADKQC